MRATFSPNHAFRQSHQVSASLTTLEQPVELDDTAKAAVITTAIALGADASNAKAYSLGCGMELLPDPERRLTLGEEKDALGLPRLKLSMRMAEQDFTLYHQTLWSWDDSCWRGTGMLKITAPTGEEYGLG
jgi:hypothetical protein